MKRGSAFLRRTTGRSEVRIAVIIMAAMLLAYPSLEAATNPPSRLGGGSLCPCSAGTTVVLLNQTPNQVRIFISDFSFGVVQAESFVLSNATISEIRIWGVYFHDNTPHLDDFTVIFHDDAGGLPGAYVAPPESGLAAACREMTGESIVVNSFDVDEYVYRLELASPVTFPNFGRYWIEVFNDSTGNQSNAFHWESGAEDPVFGFFNHSHAFEAPGFNWIPSEGAFGGSLAVQLCAVLPEIFTDGFESGDATMWSTTVP